MKAISGLLATVLAMLCLSLTINAATYYTGNLTSSQEVPPTSSTATGFGRVTLNDAENQITVSLTFTGLSSNQTASHIHGAALPGQNAGVLFNIGSQNTTSGTFIALTFAVTPTQVADLKAGRWYFNVHSANNPNGEIRGQIGVDSPYVSNLSSNQEVPANASTATGFGTLSLSSAGTQGFVTMNFSGLTTNATAAHIHSGRVGTNGAVICNFNPPAATSGAVTDVLCTFTAAQATAIRTAQTYFNVHTSTNPGGEIRGQVQRRRSTVLDFDGDSKTDYWVARRAAVGSPVEWYVAGSTGTSAGVEFGASGDFAQNRLMAGDYDGDGKDDITVWRVSADPDRAYFYIIQSSNNAFRPIQFGRTGDDPRMIYDYDGDGRTDPAVWRSGTPAFLYYQPSANNPNNNFVGLQWGSTGDFPNPGDFDGDGKGDICVQRSSGGSGLFHCFNSTAGYKAFFWGTSSDFIAPGDYDGDGKTDITAIRTESSQRVWYALSSLDGSYRRVVWGSSSAARTQGDYDGDGKTDFAVWVAGSPSLFHVQPANGSSSFSFPWGASTDIAVNAYNTR